MKITNADIKENIERAEKGEPLTKPLILLNGKFKKKWFGDKYYLRQLNQEYQNTDKYKQYKKQYQKTDKYKQYQKRYYLKRKYKNSKLGERI